MTASQGLRFTDSTVETKQSQLPGRRKTKQSQLPEWQFSVIFQTKPIARMAASGESLGDGAGQGRLIPASA
jgi:hypothetical protein